MAWQLEKIDSNTVVLRYNPSMISIFFYIETWNGFIKFFSEIDTSKLILNEPVTSEDYSFNLSLLDNGHKIIELYFSNKGVAFVIFYEYFELLIELCRKEVGNVG